MLAGNRMERFGKPRASTRKWKLELMSLLQGVSKENAVMGGVDGTKGSLPGPVHLDSVYESLESPPQCGGRTVVPSVCEYLHGLP